MKNNQWIKTSGGTHVVSEGEVRAISFIQWAESKLGNLYFTSGTSVHHPFLVIYKKTKNQDEYNLLGSITKDQFYVVRNHKDCEYDSSVGFFRVPLKSIVKLCIQEKMKSFF